MSTAILGPIRHRCHTCGSGCIGTDVYVLEDERARLQEQAWKLGIEAPLSGGLVRQVERRCVFLDNENLCQIHSRWGIDAKPRVCQQYPLSFVEVGPLQMRAAIDPGCMHAWADWRAGPEAELKGLVVSNGRRVLEWEAEEEALLALLDPAKRRLAGILEALEWSPSDLAEQLIGSNLDKRLLHPDTSEPIRNRLAHVATFIYGLDEPPPLRLSPVAESWGIEVVRRFLFIRASRDGRPLSQTIAMLAGVYACGWADPAPERFGPAISAWSRVMRTPAWKSLFEPT